MWNELNDQNLSLPKSSPTELGQVSEEQTVENQQMSLLPPRPQIQQDDDAMLAVVLPDENGSYSYYLETRTCCDSNCTTHHTNKLFTIIRKNKFNRVKNAENRTCDNKETIWTGTCSYIEAVKWIDFISNYQKYVDKAVDRQDNIDEYDICKEV